MSNQDFFVSEWAGVEDAWRRWQDEVRAQGFYVTEWILELARLRPGAHVLDLASGVGEPALAVARRVGPTGRVVATDLVAGALSFIEQTARAEGLTWLTTELAEMEQLPFADRTFDAVTCRLGVMFCPQPELALGEARRVLKPGGRAAFIAWGRKEQPLFKATLAAVAEATSLSDEPEPLSGLGPFRYEREGTLQAALERAGFSDVDEEHREIPWPFRGSAVRFWEMFSDLAGPSFRRTMDALEPKRREELRARVTQNIDAFQRGPAIDPKVVVVGCSGSA